jgi:peptidoglycan/LPS O-acetylase OafA/YrhL
MATEVRSLTGLRGIAASTVVLYHLAEVTPLAAAPPQRILMHGYLAVDVFFILSGFVMALTYAGNFSRGFDADAYWDFLRRRFARIYPLYAVILALVVVGVACGVFPTWHLRLGVAPIAANVLLIQAWGASASLNRPAWSISAEFAAYLLFPMLLRATLFGGHRLAWRSAIMAAVLLVLAAILGPHLQAIRSGTLDLYYETTPLPLLRCLAGFTFGLLAYRLAGSPTVMRLARHDLTAVVLIALLVVALLLNVNDLAIYVLLPPLVLCLYANGGRLGRVLGHGVIYRLGTLSYAIYLLHDGVLWSVLRLPTDSPMVIDATTIVAVLVLATLAHHFIELPGRRLIRGWRMPARQSAVA